MKGSSRKRSIPRVAVIGTGYWGKNLVRNFHSLKALAAICDTDPGTLDAFSIQYPKCATYTGLDDVLSAKDIDAVAIAAPAELHFPFVKQALLAGKDVFVEKPLALTQTEGAKLVKLAKDKGRILMVGHLLWYHPGILKLKDLIDKGKLGQVRYIYSHRLNMGKIRREENILWSFAPHDISVILGLLGEMPSEVSSHGGNYLQNEIADVTMSNFSFPSGVTAHVFVSWLHPFKEQKLVVVGSKQMAVMDDVEKEHKLVLYPHSVEWKGRIPIASKAAAIPVKIGKEEPLKAECKHFLNCVTTRETPRTDGNEAMRVLKVLNDCQAQLEGRTTEPPAKKPGDFFAHETAVIDDGAKIGKDSMIWHFSHVMKGTTMGRNCRVGQNVLVGPNAKVGNGVKIQNNVAVYEGITLEDDVFCGPSMVFTNVFNPRSAISRMDELRPTLVKKGATLGANCTIICGTTVGEYAFVGAGAVVSRSVPAYALVVGVPAKQTGWMCECGVKLSFRGKKATCKCGLSYSKNKSSIRRNKPAAGRHKKKQ